MIFGRKRLAGSVLSRQKPKKGKRGPAPRSRKGDSAGGRLKGALVLVGILSLAAGGLALKRQLVKITGISSAPPAWAVSLKVDGEAALSEPTILKVHEAARRNLGHGSAAELARTAAAIQKLDAFAHVAVVRLSAAQAAVSVTPRTPVLCVEAGETHFVGTEGEVFGAAVKEPSECPGAMLTGIFEDRGRKLVAATDLTYPTTAEELGALKEAVTLQGEFKARKLPVKGLTYQRYRGFLVSLSDPAELEVQLGRAPFNAKLDKLEGILVKLREKGSHAERIELDYQGKAFVKFKKM